MSRAEPLKPEHQTFSGEVGTGFLHDKTRKLAEFVKKDLPGYLNLGNWGPGEDIVHQKLETVICQLLGEVGKGKLAPVDWFYIAAASVIYAISMPREYEDDESYAENRKVFQVKNREYLKEKCSEMGLEEIEADILMLIGFSDVTPKNERDAIILRLYDSPDVSVKFENVRFLEALFELAALLCLEVSFHQSDGNIIEVVKIEHGGQKIVIEAGCREPYEEEVLEQLAGRIDKTLKRLQKKLENHSVRLNTVSLTSTVEAFVPRLGESNFFGRKGAVDKTIEIAEEKKIAIVTGSAGVGISATLKYGVEPELRSRGIHTIYCSVGPDFQQSILRTLDRQFPECKAENVFAQLEMLLSKKHVLVLMLDHFEKVFTVDGGNKLAIDMFNFIKRFNWLGSNNCRLIIGIKEDFLGNLYQFSQEIHGLYARDARYFLKNLDRSSAGEVMEKTIELMELPVDKLLIEAMQDDLTQNNETIYPPLIRMLFSQLNKKHKARYVFGSKKNPLSSEFYKDSGGAPAVLLDYAREKFERLRGVKRDVAEEIIQEMVTPFFTTQRLRHQKAVEINDKRVDIELLLQRLLRFRFLKRIQTAGEYEYELTHDFLKGLAPIKPAGNDIENTSSLVRDAIAYIDSNYHKPISLQEVAKKVGVSPEHLSRRFKARLEIGFKDYVTKKRIEKAEELLLRFPELPINEVSQKAGYTSPQNFINNFKGEKKITPLKFRQKSQAQSNSTEKSNVSNQ